MGGGYSDERESIEYYRALREEESGKFCCDTIKILQSPPPTVTNNEWSLNISFVVDYLMIDHG